MDMQQINGSAIFKNHFKLLKIKERAESVRRGNGNDYNILMA